MGLKGFHLINWLWVVFIGLSLMTCSPKSGQVASENTAPVVSEPVQFERGPCTTFENNPHEDEATTAYVLYRDFLKQEDYESAFPYWQRVYELAPAADGQRNTVFADGIRFYEHFLSNEKDSIKQEAYIDTIFQFFDEISICFGDQGYSYGRKAFDLYYKYKNRADQQTIYDLFKKSIEIDEMDCHFFILNPFAAVLVDQYRDEKISTQEAQRYTDFLNKRLSKGLESGENQAQWSIIAEYLPKRLEAFEGVPGFYDCNYYKDKYFIDFLSDSSNCDIINEVYASLKRGGCADEDPLIERLRKASIANCRTETQPSDLRVAYELLRNGEYEESVVKFEDAANSTEDIEKKATYLLLVAKIYYGHLKNFPKAREYALKAADLKGNWGEPYLLIGRLYASSGPLCGPGRGWDSQVVVWPAIDKWQYAKRIDPSVADEANTWINRYAQYMPSKEDIFQRTLNEGEQFRVRCWIQESTTIRAAN